MRVARRPTVFSFASTSHHLRLSRASAFVALRVVPLAMEYPTEIPELETRLLEEGRALVKLRQPPREARGNLAGSGPRHKRAQMIEAGGRSPRPGARRRGPAGRR